jgi:hypothetical protein
MSYRQNPYFRAAMRNESLEAACRELAMHIEARVEEQSARESASPDPKDSNESREEWLKIRRVTLALARRRREEAERHARMRNKMEPYL